MSADALDDEHFFAPDESIDEEIVQSGKRKDADQEIIENSQPPNANKNKKPKNKKLKRDPNHNDIRDLTTQADIREYLQKKLMEDEQNITEMEIEDLKKYLPQINMIRHTAGEKLPHEENISSFYKKLNLKFKPQKYSPNALVITGSALRAVHLIKDLRSATKAKIAKLFARHMKVEEQADFIKQNAVEIAVGTPNRVLKVMESLGDKEFMKRVTLLVFDCSIDEKNRTMFDIPEVRKDWALLMKRLQVSIQAGELEVKINFPIRSIFSLRDSNSGTVGFSALHLCDDSFFQIQKHPHTMIADMVNESLKKNEEILKKDEIIDEEIFCQVLGLDDDDAEFTASLLKTFQEQAEESFEKMERLLSDKDLISLAKQAHLLKGSAAALGIKKLRSSCEKIQYAGEKKLAQDEDMALDIISKLLNDALLQYKEAMKCFSNAYGLPV